MSRELQFAKTKIKDPTAPGNYEVSARTKNEPQRRNGPVRQWMATNAPAPSNHINMLGPRPNKPMTPELRAQLDTAIYNVNETIRQRRIIMEQLKHLNAQYERQIADLADLGPVEQKELEDLSREAFNQLKFWN